MVKAARCVTGSSSYAHVTRDALPRRAHVAEGNVDVLDALQMRALVAEGLCRVHLDALQMRAHVAEG